MSLINHAKKYFYVYIAIGLFFFFMWISTLVPLVGDDWGYYINGMKGPLTMTIEFYRTWSGRILGEWLGFFLAAHHEWWIYLFNPMIFSLSFLLLYKIINPKRKKGLIAMLILFFMFTVSNGIRMETFTFVVGSINYRFSLLMALVQLYLINRYFDSKSVTFCWYEYLISILAGIATGLIMENIAGGLILANLLLIGYRYISVKKLDLPLILNTIATAIAFATMRLSPGAKARLVGEFSDWVELNVFEKMLTKYPEFIHYTFTENKVLMVALILVLVVLVIQKRQVFKLKITPILLSGILLSGIPVLAASFIVNLNEHYGISFWKFTSIMYYFSDMNSWINMGYWTFLALLMLGVMIYLLVQASKILMIIYYYLIAMAVMGAMLLSPIIGPRCAIFTVYFLIMVIGLIIEELEIKPLMEKGFTVALLMAVILIFVGYGRLYTKVHQVWMKQETIINDYKNYPGGELWLPSYPAHSIHSGEAVTPYHQEVFLKYYGLPLDVKVNYSWE